MLVIFITYHLSAYFFLLLKLNQKSNLQWILLHNLVETQELLT